MNVIKAIYTNNDVVNKIQIFFGATSPVRTHRYAEIVYAHIAL